MMETNGLTAADVAAVTDRRGYGDYGNSNSWGMEWIFALLILPMLWGGNGPFGRNGDGVVTEAALCNANSFSELKGSVGRLNDQVNSVNQNIGNAVCNLGYETLRNFNSLEQLISSCCCQTQRAIDAVRFDVANYAAKNDATTVAQTQKVLDAICGLRMEMKDDRIGQMQNQINQLQLNAALCGVVRYPNQTVYSTGCNPFFGPACNCGNPNI